ncbi:MAG: DNA translocase FtsK 4TM domain-containing protein [Thermodesulfobacteriota bacterium]|nr:DNA translocase FtsK 4TM domain-containing protein [Thermodesulfobacteriota bacterium]
MKKEILGLLFFFLVVLTLVSLFSYDPGDPSINNHTFSASVEVENSFGLVGAHYSGLLISFFGLGSFWIPLLLLLTSVWYLKGRSAKIIFCTLVGGLLLIISTGSMLSIFHDQYIFFGEKISSGGMIGIPFACFLLKYTNPAGSIIILLFFAVLGSVLVTGISIVTILLFFKKTLFEFVVGFFKKMKKVFSLFGKLFKFFQEKYRKKARSMDIISLVGDKSSIKGLLPQRTSKTDELFPGTGGGKQVVKERKKAEPIIKEIKKDDADFELFNDFGDDIREKPSFILPSISLLNDKKAVKVSVDIERLRKKGEILDKKLNDFGITGEVVAILPGPVLTTFEYRPAPGIKISKIVNLTDDLALALSALSIRIIAPIPGKDVIGVELPNDIREMVTLKEILVSSEFAASTSKLTLGLGKDIFGTPAAAQLESMPHLLIAGATGTGKSVGLNAMIISILYKAGPEDVKFIMVDPKRIELSVYDGIPHLISPVVTDMKKATNALFWAVREMERRYELLAESGVRNMLQYNDMVEKKKRQAKGKKGQMPQGREGSWAESGEIDQDGESEEIPEKLPYLVVIVDELADLMMVASRDVESALTRLAQMARAAGIHLILATQRPSVDVLTGIIKANFPTRISFQVSSRIDSRTILDSNGAERLLGNGDMLFLPPGTGRLKRIQCAYVSEAEIGRITSYLREQQAPDYVEDVTRQAEEDKKSIDKSDYDEKYDEAVALITKTRQASISSVQRHLRIGYNRAARIIETMEAEGIIGPQEGSKQREVLVKSYED